MVMGTVTEFGSDECAGLSCARMKLHNKNNEKAAVQNLIFNCIAELRVDFVELTHLPAGLGPQASGQQCRLRTYSAPPTAGRLCARVREFLSCIITSLTRGARAIWRGIGTGGNRNHWRQRAVLDARAEQGEGSTSEDAVRRAFRCVRVRLAGGAQSGVSGAPWTRASHSAERTEFSRQYSWIQAAWGRAHRFDLGCRVAEGRA